MNLLIVDDEYYIVQGIIDMINKEELHLNRIFTAYSKEQAQKIIQKETINLLLTDIEMPRGSGLSLIEWIQENQYAILPLILTGHQRFDYAQRAITMHCFSYILKPVDKRNLYHELRKAVQALKQASVSSALSASADGPADPDHFISTVRSYILQHLASPDLNRSSIAEIVHMNADYFSCVFHNKFNITLSAYILSVRMDKAKELLSNTTLSVNEIGEKVGLPNTSYFHRQFKKATGQTPAQYRNQS